MPPNARKIGIMRCTATPLPTLCTKTAAETAAAAGISAVSTAAREAEGAPLAGVAGRASHCMCTTLCIETRTEILTGCITLRRATTVRGREPVRTTGGQGGSARPSPAGPESTARPGSAHPKSLASSPLHNGCSPETGPESVCTKRQCAAARKWSRQRGHDSWSSSRARSFEDGN